MLTYLALASEQPQRLAEAGKNEGGLASPPEGKILGRARLRCDWLRWSCLLTPLTGVCPPSLCEEG